MTARSRIASPATRRAKNLVHRREMLEKVANQDFDWIPPLARLVHENAEVLAKFFSEALARIASSPLENHSFSQHRWGYVKNLVKLFVPRADDALESLERSLATLEAALGEVSQDLLRNAEMTRELLPPAIRALAKAVEENPRLAVVLSSPELTREMFGPLGERIAAALGLLPALSARAAENFPDLKEIFFHSLFRLSGNEREKLYHLAEQVLRVVYREHVFPKLAALLRNEPSGRALGPILVGAVEMVPGESCLNAVLNIACTPRHQLSTGRVVAVAIQELGGLYVKISQVIAELCPPSLARELRTNQDDAGGIFPSIEKSWGYLLSTLARPEMREWLSYLEVPEKPVRHFASASVGALYELNFNAAGRERFQSSGLLIKLQRPGLDALFAQQSDYILGLCRDAQAAIRADAELAPDTRKDLTGLLETIKRAVKNYHTQSAEELDFTFEESNAARVREALGESSRITVPRYYHASKDIVLMQRMGGTKATKMVQAKYLERREIADQIIASYLDLVFEKGVVWADPHAGNILYDDVDNKVAMIDLNPCFVWDRRTRDEFKLLLYRLLLRDANGVYASLYHLVRNPESLHSNTIVDDLERFLNSPFNTSSLTRFVGEFLRTLSENSIDLRMEVQAALRGLSQLALTANAISVRNNFGYLLRRHFGLREILSTAWEVGPVRVFRVITSILFDITRQSPEQDVGPVLDERDINALRARMVELNRAGVCKIRFVRVSPEDFPNLRMSSDGSELLVTSDLRFEVLETRRPAMVRYAIEIPTRAWLRERQEFVKLSSIARNFCIVECLEQLRRNSLDDYWRIVEAWSKPMASRTLEETRLVGEVRSAARRLYGLRFAKLWDHDFTGLPRAAKRTWKRLMYVESWREDAEQKYITGVSEKLGNIQLASLAFTTFYRLKILLIEGVLWYLRRRVREFRFSMHLLPMSSGNLEDLILYSFTRKMGGSER